MAAADREPVARDEVAKELDAFGLAHVRNHGGHPFVIVAFDREFPFPPGREQIPIGSGGILFPDLVGVVGLHEHVVQGRDPFAVLGHGGRDQVLVIRRVNFLQQILAPQRFLLRRNDGDHVGAGAAGARFGDDLPQDDLRAGTPDVDLDAVFVLERLDQLIGVFDREGRIEEKRAFLLCPSHQALLPVFALIRGQILQRLRMHGVSRRRHGEHQSNENALHYWLPRLSNTSSKDLAHLSLSSSATAGSTSVKRRLPSGEGTLAWVGAYSIDTSNSCASADSMKSWNSSAAFGCGARRAMPMPLMRASAGSSTNQSIAAPLLLAASA